MQLPLRRHRFQMRLHRISTRLCDQQAHLVPQETLMALPQPHLQLVLFPQLMPQHSLPLRPLLLMHQKMPQLQPHQMKQKTQLRMIQNWMIPLRFDPRLLIQTHLNHMTQFRFFRRRPK